LQTYQINHRKIYSILLFIVKRIFPVILLMVMFLFSNEHVLR